MAIQQCTSCRGTKRVMGLGLIEKPCTECKAVGWIDLEAKEITSSVVKNVDGSIVEVKRRGRKARVEANV